MFCNILDQHEFKKKSSNILINVDFLNFITSTYFSTYDKYMRFKKKKWIKKKSFIPSLKYEYIIQKKEKEKRGKKRKERNS